MSEPITQSELDMVRDIYQRGGKLASDLRSKCNWEHMTPVAVLREWPSFVRRYRRIANAPADLPAAAGKVRRDVGLSPVSTFQDGQPCGHPGCLHHVSHPCEGCGRVAGRNHLQPNAANEPCSEAE